MKIEGLGCKHLVSEVEKTVLKESKARVSVLARVLDGFGGTRVPLVGLENGVGYLRFCWIPIVVSFGCAFSGYFFFFYKFFLLKLLFRTLLIFYSGGSTITASTPPSYKSMTGVFTWGCLACA